MNFFVLSLLMIFIFSCGHKTAPRAKKSSSSIIEKFQSDFEKKYQIDAQKELQNKLENNEQV
jgi:hypothetical protein